ncbi:hypothetical protein PSAC2689_140171 [Paraburkholderia sacchari]
MGGVFIRVNYQMGYLYEFKDMVGQVPKNHAVRPPNGLCG